MLAEQACVAEVGADDGARGVPLEWWAERTSSSTVPGQTRAAWAAAPVHLTGDLSNLMLFLVRMSSRINVWEAPLSTTLSTKNLLGHCPLTSLKLIGSLAMPEAAVKAVAELGSM